MASHSAIHSILELMFLNDLSIQAFLETALSSPQHATHPLVTALAGDIDQVLCCFRTNEMTAPITSKWAIKFAQNTYQSQMHLLSCKSSGFYFLAKNMTQDQLKSFSIEETANRMEELAPDLWKLFGILLSANPRSKYQKYWARNQANSRGDTGRRQGRYGMDDGDIEVQDHNNEDVDYEQGVDIEEDNVPLLEDGDDEPEDLEDLEKEKVDAIIVIVSKLFLPLLVTAKKTSII